VKTSSSRAGLILVLTLVACSGSTDRRGGGQADSSVAEAGNKMEASTSQVRDGGAFPAGDTATALDGAGSDRRVETLADAGLGADGGAVTGTGTDTFAGIVSDASPGTAADGFPGATADTSTGTTADASAGGHDSIATLVPDASARTEANAAQADALTGEDASVPTFSDSGLRPDSTTTSQPDAWSEPDLVLADTVTATSDAAPPSPDGPAPLADLAPLSPDVATLQDSATATSLVGLWDGTYLTTGQTGNPVLLEVIIDTSNVVYLTVVGTSDSGTGTLSASGDVVITVSGTDGGNVSFSGHFEGDRGSGSWSNTSNAHTGTWTVVRRPGVIVDASLRARCDTLAPCMGAPSATPDPSTMMPTVMHCMFAFVEPSPSAVGLMNRLTACSPASTCDALWSCYGAGSLSQAYVATTGDDANDGASATAPKRTINAAIAAVQANGTVRIAAGTYRENLLISRPVTLQGGYDAGFTRIDPVASPVVIDGQGLDATLTAFVPAPGVAPARLILRGLGIKNGFASGGMGARGGGLRMMAPLTEVVIEDCVFSGNHAQGNGGAMAVDNSVLTVLRTTIEDNTCDGNAGGGIDINRSTATVTSSILRNNHSANWGGGFNAWDSKATLDSCTITGNQAGQGGGGVAIGPGGAESYAIKDSTLTANTPNAVSGSYANLGGNTLN
jgi:hypothetical protein